MTALLHFKVRQHLPSYSSFCSQPFEQQMWSKQLASAGNRTRAARVAGEHSTTEPPMRTILLGSWHSSLHLVSEWKLLGWPCTTCQLYIWCHKCLNEHWFVTRRHFWNFLQHMVDKRNSSTVIEFPPVRLVLKLPWQMIGSWHHAVVKMKQKASKWPMNDRTFISRFDVVTRWPSG